MAEMPVKQNTDDEIDLFDLVDDVADKWYWLLGCFVLGVVVAVIYVVVAVPGYRTSSVITEVSPADLLPFNQPVLQTSIKLVNAAEDEAGSRVQVSDEPVFEIDQEAAFKGARGVVRSASARKAFYQELLVVADDSLRELIFSEDFTEEQNLSRFLEKFGFEDPADDSHQDVYLIVTFDLDSDPAAARDILNSYVQFALDLHRARVRSELDRKVDAHLRLNRSWADNFRFLYESEKLRRIALLEEAAEIAVNIGQEKPFFNTNDIIISSEPPLFMMGSRALNTEAAQLKARSETKTEDLFVVGLPVIEAYISSLESVSLNWESVKFAEVDQPALLPLKPVKPKKFLVVVFGAISGGLIGLITALIAAASSRHLRRSER